MLQARGAILASVALAATALGTILVFGTTVVPKGSGKTARPTPAPEFASFDLASRASVLAYARTLSFASVHGLSDTRRLSPSCRSCPAGPIATVESEIGTPLVALNDLGRGRIIARLINQDVVSAPDLGLSAHDTTYVWADRVGGRWRATLVPTKGDQPVVGMDLVVTRHPERRASDAMAKWVWTPEVGVTTRETTWVPCDQGCCEVRPS